MPFVLLFKIYRVKSNKQTNTNITYSLKVLQREVNKKTPQGTYAIRLTDLKDIFREKPAVEI